MQRFLGRGEGGDGEGRKLTHDVGGIKCEGVGPAHVVPYEAIEPIVVMNRIKNLSRVV